MQLHSRATTPVDSPLDEAIRRIEQRRPLMLSGVRGSSRGWLAHRLTARLAAPLVMVAESFQRAETLLEDARFFEVSTPDLDDVVRLEDDYGRAGKATP